MKEYTIVLKLRVKGEYADPTKWDWNELLNTGDDLQVLSVELVSVEKPLCQRTHALYKPGETIPRVHCVFTYTGEIPCTGPQRCVLCGKAKPT